MLYSLVSYSPKILEAKSFDHLKRIDDDYGFDPRGRPNILNFISHSISNFRQYCKKREVPKVKVQGCFEGPCKEGEDRELRSSTTGLSGLRQLLSSLALSIR